MYKELLLDKIGIDSIVGLANFIEENRSFEELQVESVDINNKDYKLAKRGNMVSIESPTGELLTVSVNDNEIHPFDRRDVKVLYTLSNKDYLEFEGTASVDRDGIDKDELTDSLKVKYIRSITGESYDLGWDLYPKEIEDTDDGIKYHNLYVSFDGNEILKINGESIPSKQAIIDFNANIEKEKVYKIIDNENIQLNEVTKKYLDEAITKACSKSSYLKKSMKDYEKVTKIVTNLINVRDTAVDEIEEFSIKGNEINESTEWLTGLVTHLMNKYDITKIKKLVKND